MTDLMLPPDTGTDHRYPEASTDNELLDDFDGRLRCSSVTDITHDVRSFSFTLDDRAQLRFTPGQYLTLQVPVDGVPVERCYTISSAPADADELTITVKRVPDGPVSNWLHDHLRVGDVLHGSGPLGVFSSDHHPAEQLVLLSAGSGITPVMSMLREMINRGSTQQIRFIHSARSPDDIIFRAELEWLDRYPNVDVTIICEGDSATEHWQGPTGRLSPAVLLKAAPALLGSEIFTCGPAPYMAAVREMVDLLGVDPGRYHEESFVLGTPGAPLAPSSTETPPADAPTTATHQVEFRRAGRTIDCDASTSILTAASAAGIPLPSSCGEGVCGSCKQDLLSGEVDMQHAGGIRPKEIRQGKVLLCSAKPTSDLIIDA